MEKAEKRSELLNFRATPTLSKELDEIAQQLRERSGFPRLPVSRGDVVEYLVEVYKGHLDSICPEFEDNRKNQKYSSNS